VAPGDTLARIAVGLHGEASLNRMMIALQRANPDAFIHDNINLLKSGSVLRIPAREEVQTLSPDEANLLVQQQVESWHRSLRPSLQTEAETGAIARPVEQPAPATADAGSQPEVARPVKPKARPKAEIAQSKAAKPDVAKPAADTAANDETANKPAARPAIARVSRAHLEIVPPVGSGSRGTQSGASAGGSGSELRAELAQTKEDLAARKAEIGELKSRVGDLEKMQQDNQSLLAMKDSKLAEMQQRLAELEKNSATTPAGNANAASAASSSATATGPASVMPTSTANASADAAASPTRPEILAKAAKPVPQAGVVETPWYQRPLVLIGAGLLLLGGLLGLMLRHGRRPPDTAARVGRYSSGTLAASLASVRAAAAEGGSGATESPVPEEQAVDHASVVVQPAAVPPVVAADIPVTAAASAQQVRRPYWAGPNVATPKVQEASGPIVDPQADKPAPKSAATKAAAPKGKSADAASAAGNDDWALDAQPASAAAVTRQRPAAPAAGESDQGVATKMELARAYIDIGDAEGARGMLEEVLMEGTASQREDALKLLETLE
jgi:pilus assembly protein FimV